MAKKHRPCVRKREHTKGIVIVRCEGKHEKISLDILLKVPDSAKFTIRVQAVAHSKSNALALVTKAANNEDDVAAICCVFDRDKQSNTEDQCREINKIIAKNNKLVRICSNPCFEVIYWLNSATDQKNFTNCKDCIKAVNSKLQSDNIQYDKDDDSIKKVAQHVDFTKICDNAKRVYDKLEIDGKKINNDNWYRIDDAYSEIFKLKDYLQ